uniref:Uncharacterized protein n=1 Tax=Anguilla anguilla TaxID=7936 RepID=A0A0E9VMZ7_ANGAN
MKSWTSARHHSESRLAHYKRNYTHRNLLLFCQC